jgi:wyosine [tRNA(Phe)-imidazoG37] synthetase (radical SAM superfamily)
MSIHVYGPVPSRRLGRSLGIDVTPPLPNKTCNYNCVYCQLGRTRHFTNQRREFFPVDRLLSQAEERIDLVGSANIDYLTLVGDGEPTLYSRLGVLIENLKENYNIPICLLTNGALLSDEKLRNEVMEVDLIMPTLDSGIEKEFKHINRPIRHVSFHKMVKGMLEFSENFDGQIWYEFMAIQGINDNYESLEKVRAIYEKLEPDRIYINTPIRPPCESWVKTPPLSNIKLIQDVLKSTVKEDVIPINLSEQGEFFIDGDTEDKIIQNLINTIKRHPMRQDQIESVLEKKNLRHPDNIIKRILELNIEKTDFQGDVFFSYYEP